MSHSPSRDVLITTTTTSPPDDTATLQVLTDANHNNTTPSPSHGPTTTFSLINHYIDQTVMVEPSTTPPQQTIVNVGSPEGSNPQEPATKPHALRRFLSYTINKSSSFLTGYRFVNFPGLRAHSNIKDTYQRLSVSYYSVYFVFHLFFSISSRYYMFFQLFILRHTTC